METDDRSAEFLREAIGPEAPTEVDARLRQSLDAFRARLAGHPCARDAEGPRHVGHGLHRAAIRVTLAAGGLAATILVAALVLGRSTPTWADVVESFGTVRFFSAVLYFKEGALSEPRQIELWVGEGGKARVRVGTQVLFADHGSLVRAFDVKTRKEPEADRYGVQFVKMLGTDETFSLESVLRTFSAAASEMAPVANAEVDVSTDLLVFDIQSKISPEWMRIWTLREGRLPVRILVHDPRDGETCDVVFSYTRQPQEFFDPNAFEKEVAGRPAAANLAYALAKDPGGRPLTPGDMFDKSTGYHVPTIEDAGISPDGIAWVVAGKAANRMPSGAVFHGFTRLEDDLGRRYLGVGDWTIDLEDRISQAFVSTTYPFDERLPGELIFVAEVEHERPPQLIGRATVREPKPGAAMPGFVAEISDWRCLGVVAGYHVQRRDWAALDRILALVPGAPEEDSHALWRERTRLERLVIEGKWPEADALASRLLPLEDRPRDETRRVNAHSLNTHIVAIAGAGRLEEARRVFGAYVGLDPVVPVNLDARQVESTRSYLEQVWPSAISALIHSLSQQAGLSIDEINHVLGTDVRSDSRCKDHNYWSLWDWSPSYSDTRWEPWRRHIKDLSQYYHTHPVPERVQVLPYDGPDLKHWHLAALPGLGTPRVEFWSGSLAAYARGALAQSTGDLGSVIVPDDIASIQLRHDVVYDRRVERTVCFAALLDTLGLEWTQETIARKVLVARYDGRPLPAIADVNPPVERIDGAALAAGMPYGTSWPGLSMPGLLWHIMYGLNMNRTSDFVLILDETGLPGAMGRGAHEDEVVYRHSINWDGDEALPIARKWLEETFGVTLTEETRDMPVRVLRRKGSGVPSSVQ